MALSRLWKRKKTPRVQKRQVAERLSPVLKRRKIERSDISLSKGTPENRDFVLLTDRFITLGTFLGQVISGKIMLTHKKKVIRASGQLDKETYVKIRWKRIVDKSSFNPVVDRIVEFERASEVPNRQ